MSVGEFETQYSELGDPQPRPSMTPSPSLTSRDSANHSLPVAHSATDVELAILPINAHVSAKAKNEAAFSSLDTSYVVPTRPEHPPVKSESRPLHRLAEVRKQQGVTRRNLARRLNLDLETVREHEEPTTDLSLSLLYKYQQVLEVPVVNLLVDLDDPLASSVLDRARLVRVMKTAMAILEKAEGVRLKRMAEMLVEQLVEMMPELKEVSAWHTIGRRRNLEDFGRILERVLPDEMFGTE